MELIESGENKFCCNALGWHFATVDTKECAAFREIFGLKDGQTFTMLAFLEKIPLEYNDNYLKNLRLMALAMAEAVLFCKDRK